MRRSSMPTSALRTRTLLEELDSRDAVLRRSVGGWLTRRADVLAGRARFRPDLQGVRRVQLRAGFHGAVRSPGVRDHPRARGAVLARIRGDAADHVGARNCNRASGIAPASESATHDALHGYPWAEFRDRGPRADA